MVDPDHADLQYGRATLVDLYNGLSRFPVSTAPIVARCRNQARYIGDSDTSNLNNRFYR